MVQLNRAQKSPERLQVCDIVQQLQTFIKIALLILKCLSLNGVKRAPPHNMPSRHKPIIESGSQELSAILVSFLQKLERERPLYSEKQSTCMSDYKSTITFSVWMLSADDRSKCSEMFQKYSHFISEFLQCSEMFQKYSNFISELL